jgi:hypothetical protein
MEFVQSDKTITVRQPSTANLMVDSADRSSAYLRCNDFLISKNQSLMNGFFTRVGTTEIVFEWTTPNVDQFVNGSFIYDTIGTSSTENTFALNGFFNMEEAIDTIEENVNGFTSTTGLTWTFTATQGGGVELQVTGGVDGDRFALESPLLMQMFGTGSLTGLFPPSGVVTFDLSATPADLRPARYVDIVCTQLTNNQNVKDASTAPIVRDVLCRWYFDYDAQTPTDAYGYPILMGYSPFFLRRLYNPPKQIQWQTNVPIGQLSFQLFNNNGSLQKVESNTNYLMTLQMSEN